VFEKHETRDLIIPDTVMLLNATTWLKQMKPLVRVIYNSSMAFGDKDGKCDIPHLAKMLNAPKTIISKLKSFVPSCNYSQILAPHNQFCRCTFRIV
jgi:hypothetical protein